MLINNYELHVSPPGTLIQVNTWYNNQQMFSLFSVRVYVSDVLLFKNYIFWLNLLLANILLFF